MNLSNISKAIAGGLVGIIVAEAAHFGWQPDGPTLDALSVIITGIVGYAVGHVVVYFAPRNK